MTPVYVQGAFARAARVRGDRSLVRRFDTAIGGKPFDPFEMLQLVGKDGVRVRLRALSRAELLAMIGEYGLNPGAKSLVRLSDSQLVIFIVTAVEVQSARRNPAR